MKTTDTIIICITIIILLSIGVFVMAGSNHQEESVLTMVNSPNLYEGDSLILSLSDGNGTAIANQKVQINLTHANGITENFTLKTNAEGQCKLEDLIADNFTLSSRFDGNKDYKAATLSGNIYVKKKQSSSQSQNNDAGTNTNSNFKTDNKVDDVVNGWDPSEHEVSREDLGDGTVRITYDDGYFRIVDKDGNILTYGY